METSRGDAAAATWLFRGDEAHTSGTAPALLASLGRPGTASARPTSRPGTASASMRPPTARRLPKSDLASTADLAMRNLPRGATIWRARDIYQYGVAVAETRERPRAAAP